LADYFPEAEFYGDVVRACGLDQPPSDFGLWSPERTMTFMEAARHFRMNPDEPGFLLLPLEEATDMDVPTFYDIFKASRSEGCLETPKALWPPQQ